MGDLQRDLVDQGFELRETHISWVFLGRDVVYKCKKPVSLGFLDFSTLDLRKRYCELEVSLNRRLAADVYRGVVPIAIDAGGVHRVGGSGPAVEWAVEMRRLPERDAADRRLRDGRLDADDVRRLAEHVARFHEAARADEETARYGDIAVIEANVAENFDQTRESAGRFLAPRELAALEHWQHAFLREHRDRFSARCASGRIRDGHGDLRLEHCYLGDDGSIDVIDCIEFNDRFRYGDVCADAAFLAMDLDWHERSDLSAAFLASYARATQDYDLYGVVDFYESYRAYVRGKVSAMLADDAHAGSAARERAVAQARKYFLLSEACTRPPLSAPRLFAVGGLIAAGKSTVAERLAAHASAPVIDSDRTRKHLAGVDPFTPLSDAPFAGHYDQATTAAVYDELLRRADVVLRSGRSAVLDASFRERARRLQALELARRCGAELLFIECVAPDEVIHARLSERARARSISDGRMAVLPAFKSSFEPVDELPAASHVRIDTTGPVDPVLSKLV